MVESSTKCSLHGLESIRWSLYGGLYMMDSTQWSLNGRIYTVEFTKGVPTA